MKAVRPFIVAAAIASVAACASTSETARLDTRPRVILDEDYMAAVDSAAAKSPVRVRVFWVNPPKDMLDE